MKLMICGSRTLTQRSYLLDAIRQSKINPKEVDEVLLGGARGVDALGKWWAEGNHLNYRIIPADWKHHGRAAGPIRNAILVALADYVIAIWDGESPGTKDVALRSALKDKPILLMRPGEKEHIFRFTPPDRETKVWQVKNNFTVVPRSKRAPRKRDRTHKPEGKKTE